MIEARCRTLSGKFSVARKAYELEERLDRVQGAVGSVQALRHQAEKASAILKTLSSRTTDPEARAGIANAVRITEARRGLVALWKELKRDDNLLARTKHGTYKRAFHATENACDKLKRAAEQAWRDHARSCLSHDGPILNVFRGSNPKVVASLELLRRELLTLRRATFPSPNQIKAFDQKVAAYTSAFRTLGGGDIPTPVRDALQAAASPDGAPIGLFSPYVVAWLRDYGVAESFRVTAKEAP